MRVSQKLSLGIAALLALLVLIKAIAVMGGPGQDLGFAQSGLALNWVDLVASAAVLFFCAGTLASSVSWMGSKAPIVAVLSLLAIAVLVHGGYALYHRDVSVDFLLSAFLYVVLGVLLVWSKRSSPTTAAQGTTR